MSSTEPDNREASVIAYYPRLFHVKEYVDQHYREHIMLKDAARVARLEEKYFSAFFRAKMGICFCAWLAQVRIDKAMELIERKDITLTEVGFSVGFRDLRTFERAFKKRTGMTPRTFKRKVRPE